MFGLGCMRDVCRLPDYVAEANQDHEYMNYLKNKMRYHKK